MSKRRSSNSCSWGQGGREGGRDGGREGGKDGGG